MLAESSRAAERNHNCIAEVGRCREASGRLRTSPAIDCVWNMFSEMYSQPVSHSVSLSLVVQCQEVRMMKMTKYRRTMAHSGRRRRTTLLPCVVDFNHVFGV